MASLFKIINPPRFPFHRITPTPSSSRSASTSSSDSLSFPTHPNPTPWEIFHLPTTTPLTASQVKHRYYELCRLFHPDVSLAAPPSIKGKEKAKDTSKEFKQVVAAYEVLRNPAKRAVYLRNGRAPRDANGDVWSQAGGYDFSRGHPRTYKRGPYPSAAWDWADPHNLHFRPGAAGTGMPTGSASGWSSNGHLTSNGTVFLVLLGLTIVVTPISVWSLVPPESILPAGAARSAVVDGVRTESDWRAVTSGGDRRHRDAVRALEQARREAKVNGMKTREALK